MGQNLCYCYTNNSKISDDININTPNQKQKQITNKKQNNFTIQTAEIKISNDNEFKLKNGQKEPENKMASERYNNKSLNIPAQNVGISNDKFKIKEIVGSGNTEINVCNSKENINNFKPTNSLKNSSTKINDNENVQSNNNIEIEENENNENNNEENYNFIEDENDINNNNNM